VKKLIKYWLPPILWMAFMFPVGNKAFSSPWLYQFIYRLGPKIFPGISFDTLGMIYIIIRKTMHFIEYAILAFLLYRAFRGTQKRRWSLSWAIQAAVIAVPFGFLDEYLQSFVPNRRGSPLDWGIDSAGVILALAALGLRNGTDKKSGTESENLNFNGKGLWLKRLFDIALSSFGILLSSPLWLLFGFLVWIQDRSPVFYTQERVGKDGRIFRAFKFRSMIKDAEKEAGPVQAVANDPRVTKIGRILRATAMDELPQLWNIFKGDMSFVGPRALRPAEKEVHGDGSSLAISEIPGYEERHKVRPGLTGLAQVYLPGDAPRIKKFEYDLRYIETRSFGLDLKTIFLSFWITFRGKWESREKKV
jgi:lipopolysaccharide/colanic/teichoic acid biosynthesis glycosyltransferase